MTVLSEARTLRLTSPLMHGGDVKALQQELNGWFKRWHVPNRIDADGEYGPATRGALKLVCYGLGVNYRDGATPTVRRKIRDTNLRTDREKRIGGERADWRKRLKHRFEDKGADAAVAYALKMSRLGIREQPSGSNLGPYITEWARLTGYKVPPGVYWCGCFVNACLVAAGFEADHTLGYCPSVEARAKAGTDGWRWANANANPRKGWLPLFGARIADHIEIVVADGFPLRTVGGNTSAGNGSPNNGGGVYAHNFSTYRGLPLRGYAIPPFKG